MSSQKKCVPLVTEPRYARTCCRNLCTMIYNNLPCSGPKTRHLPVAVDVTTDIARDCEVISVFCVVYTSGVFSYVSPAACFVLALGRHAQTRVEYPLC